ncbi:MAG: caspase family protein [Alphaproteobacteria bacterium]
MRAHLERLAAAVAVLALVLIGFEAAPAGAAGELPKQPALRLETGYHTAAISRLSADREGKLLATASDDKTVRLWSVPDGRLVRVLRPPIGPVEEGQIYAVAVSPDGALVAAGGMTGAFWDGKVSIYVFDAQTGDIVRRLTGLSGQVQHLAFSPDGSRLAAALGLRAGLRVWNTGDWTLATEDRAYGGPSYGLAFDRDGRLATTSDDGQIRLYDKGGQLLRKAPAPGGGQPDGIAFSPDGRQIAIGYADGPKVDVIGATDLAPLFKPDLTGVRAGSLARVAWSADGQALFASGRYSDASGQSLLRRWGNAGRGTAADSAIARDTVTVLLPVAGGLAFAASDASFGVLDDSGRPLVTMRSSLADFRDMGGTFQVSRDGAVVRFGLDGAGRRPIRFDLAARKLSAAEAADKALSPPVTSGLPVADWKNAAAPKLSGKSLALDADEISRSLAIAPARDRFVLGTDWFLRAYDAKGAPLWKTPVPAAAWAVNVTGDGSTAVAALGDGTIRWYRLADGHVLLNLFPLSDGARWVAWTPSGYYDAGAGGDTLIGWHVNNTRDDAASFFSVARFSEAYYRKDVVARVLTAQGEQKAIEQINGLATRSVEQTAAVQDLPPEVRILSPRDGSAFATPTVKVDYAIKSRKPIRSFMVRVDGRAAESVKGAPTFGGTEAKGTVEIAVPPRTVEIALIAGSEDRESEPQTLQLRWSGAAASTVKPRMFAVLVGVSEYENPSLRLKSAAKDASDVDALLKGQSGKLYQSVNTKLLTDAAANRENIIDGFDWLEKSMTRDDVGLIFLAGHGATDEHNRYTFVSVNVTGKTNEEFARKLKSQGVRFGDILDTIRGFKGSTYLFIDTCHSGDVLGAAGADVNKVVNDLSAKGIGLTVFASSQGNEYSIEDDSLGNGLFTWAIKDGLSPGKDTADANRDGRVSIEEISTFVSRRVQERSRELLTGADVDQKAQTPMVMPTPASMRPEERSRPLAVVAK